MARTIDPSRIEVVDEKVAQILRRKTPAQRLELAFSCNRTLRQLLHASLTSRFPSWDQATVRREVSRRFHDRTE